MHPLEYEIMILKAVIGSVLIEGHKASADELRKKLKEKERQFKKLKNKSS